MSEDDALPELTPNQLAYVLARRKGLNKSDSYRAAYDCSNMKPESLWVEASRIETHPKVSLWIGRLVLEQIKAADYSLDEHIKELEDVKQRSLSSGNMGAAVNAIVSKGKAKGLYVERIEDVTPTNTDVEQAIIELFGQEMADSVLGSKH